MRINDVFCEIYKNLDAAFLAFENDWNILLSKELNSAKKKLDALIERIADETDNQ